MAVENVRDLWRKIEEHEALLAKQVYIEGDAIIIHVSYPYPIELGRCDTHAKVLAWVVQLADKTWATPLVIQRFVQLAAAQHGLEVALP